VAQETFISYRNFRWLKITALALILCASVYVMNDPVGGRNGGTVVGYSFGTISTIGIVWLMAYGARKRAYQSSLGTVEGWLAAHVWLGLGLLALVPLHAGFSFGANVHTLAYVLMVITILTGVWGMVNYATLADRIESHRGGGKRSHMLEQVQSLSQEIEALCAGKSDAFLELVQRFDFNFAPTFISIIRKAQVPHVDQNLAGGAVLKVPESERDDSLRVIGAIDRKSDLAILILEEARIRTLLRLWLFIHVPVSVALCVAVVIHILLVFFFR
jgi:hypothetical protein